MNNAMNNTFRITVTSWTITSNDGAVMSSSLGWTVTLCDKQCDLEISNAHDEE